MHTIIAVIKTFKKQINRQFDLGFGFGYKPDQGSG
jgi:hypothetical protein